MARGTRTFQLTRELVAQHTAGQVVCLDHRAEGRVYHLHEERPGADLNSIVATPGGAGPVDHPPAGPALTIVEIRGVLEQRAGYHDYCGGWSDGHDAVAERLIDAMKDGDVLMVIDSPGGAHAGLEEAVRRVLDAKDATGARVYAVADEVIGSAAYWWAAAVADEIYVPPSASGRIGSIGARSGHQSIAGALKKAGVATTYFVWPGDGKAAFAPELPLSDVGRSRGERDVNLAGESFAEAVEMGRGITREQIIALDADCLSGESAVAAGLADGVASIEDVIAHALTNAGEAEATMSNKSSDARAEEYEREEKTTIRERFEGDEPEESAEDEPEEDAEGEEDEGDSPDEMEDEEPEPDAEGEPDPDEEDEEPEESAEDEPPPSSKRMAARTAKPAMRRPRKNTLAEIVGLPARSSDLAVQTQVRTVMNTLKQTMGALGVSSMDQLVGAARATAEDAKQVGVMRAENKRVRKLINARRRMDLAMKLINAGVVKRSDLFITTVSIRADGSEKKTDALAPEWKHMRLSDFESYAARKLKTAKAGPKLVKATPFEPDRKAATETSAANGYSLEAAMKNPVVIQVQKRTGQPLEQCAQAYLATRAQGRDHLNHRKSNQAGDPAI